MIHEAGVVDEVENQKSSRRKMTENPKPPRSGINFIDLLEDEGGGNA
jgi:hypothetical protein